MKPTFMIDIEATTLTPAEKKILALPQVGAVILFTRNFENREQLCNLVKDIRSVNPSLVISVDHEGGYIQRFQRHGFRAIPAPRVLGELYDKNAELAVEMSAYYGHILARDLVGCGINLGLSPVLDLHGDNPVIGALDRAFHHDPEVVTVLAESFIEGMKKAGMPAVGKHFPGHGSCNLDSHLAKPQHDASLEALLSHDLKPFASLVARQKLDYVMPAHIVYPQVDWENTAGFSRTWLQTILREKLGFQGVIISDCINMAGADVGDLSTRASMAFSAGCNIVTVTNMNYQPWPELHDFIEGYTV